MTQWEGRRIDQTQLRSTSALRKHKEKERDRERDRERESKSHADPTAHKGEKNVGCNMR